MCVILKKNLIYLLNTNKSE